MEKKNKNLALIAAGMLIGALAGYFAFIHDWTPFDSKRPAVGDLAPALDLVDTSGGMLSLKDHKGKVVLVNFWATWCPPCKQELEWFQRAYLTREDKGFVVIALAIDELKPDTVRELNLAFPMAMANERVMQEYGSPKNVPVSFLIGRDGRIIKKVRRVYEEEAMRADVDAALALK